MGRRIVINDACVGCAFCMLVCPYDALEVFGKAEVDYKACTACMKCVTCCPNSAITTEGTNSDGNPDE
jgi:Fe-S-cluster-containing hydrogenase component 2